ncbi:putative ABC transport system permease protein [Kitasatospora sp. MAP12-15]|uniref:ABC transporter permease n=1 Tax=unclassified Kitasatospora TaxID=2633591 RepID=UPI00247583AA|nr:ABC transporter permease [Kitasatospora sp. MAP12-44]MDH6112532.1 putative ABC transport system permease protein [Kitasatospora sp. MAP12-44]
MSAFRGSRGAGRRIRLGRVGRRRVQTIVMTLSVLMAVASAVVAGSLMVSASAPFDAAFAQQHGAQLTAQIDESSTGVDRIAATGQLPGVTASSGPYQTAQIDPPGPGGLDMQQSQTIVGRSAPTGVVDDLVLRSGRWATNPGEIVLSMDANSAGPGTKVGSILQISPAAGSPTLTIVGLASSVTDSADGWVVPAEIAALRASGAPGSAQMLYRFSAAASTAEMNADRAAVAAALPAGAITGAQSYLDVKLAADENTALFVPVMMAFGVLGLLMSVIIIASVVSGAVGAQIRRIGILKSIGLTPGQVVRTYLAQALVPSAIGAVSGVLLGNLLAMPLMGDAGQMYGGGSPGVAWWIDLAVPGAALAVVALAALVPALRAGRLRTVEALAVGRAPRSGRGQWAQRLAARLPLPRAVTLGLASPFARPVRSAALLAAVLFGTTAATFAIGLTSSASAVTTARQPGQRIPVSVFLASPGDPGSPAPQGGDTAADPVKTLALIQAQLGTAAAIGQSQGVVTVAGGTGAIRVRLYQGQSNAEAFALISGRWFNGPGEVVVPTHFLDTTGHKVGDSITLVDQGVQVPVRIVGEDFDPGNAGLVINTDMATLAAAQPKLHPDFYDVTLKPGTSVAGYVEGLRNALQSTNAHVEATQAGHLNPTVVAFDAMAVLLTLMLVSVAGLGVLNSVVLDTRERVHDLGVCKAIGMTPGQTITQVLTSVAGAGLLGGAVGVPVGLALHDVIIPLVMRAAGSGTPPQVQNVYGIPELVLLGVAGVAIALCGAMLPAGWAAKARTATALRTE